MPEETSTGYSRTEVRVGDDNRYRGFVMDEADVNLMQTSTSYDDRDEAALALAEGFLIMRTEAQALDRRIFRRILRPKLRGVTEVRMSARQLYRGYVMNKRGVNILQTSTSYDYDGEARAVLDQSYQIMEHEIPAPGQPGHGPLLRLADVRRPLMARGFDLNWYGDAILKSLLEAAREGIDETMEEATADAVANTPVVTGTLQGSIRPHEPAEIKGKMVEGVWGSQAVHYAIYVETGTSRSRGRHMLGNAADKEYPKLTQRIARNVK